MRGIKSALGRLRRCAFRLVAGIFREDILAWNEALRECEQWALEAEFAEVHRWIMKEGPRLTPDEAMAECEKWVAWDTERRKLRVVPLRRRA